MKNIAHYMGNYKGEFLVILSLALWGFFPIVTIFTYQYMDFKLSLAFATLFSFFYFLVLYFINNDSIFFHQKEGWFDLIMASFINGVIYYFILFYGLQLTTSINGSIFSLSEIFFSFLLFGFLFGPDKAKISEIIGALLMVCGILVVLFSGTFELNYGDLFIIVASMFSPIGNYFSKRTIKLFPSRFLMLIRSFISSVFLFLYLFLNDGLNFFYNDFISALPYLLFLGILLLGFSKVLWINSYKYITVHRASIFICLYPVFTIVYNIFLFSKFPSLYQILGLVPIVIGVYFIFRHKIKSGEGIITSDLNMIKNK